MQINQKKQTGFTLIELVVVIVILGILAATALPKFVDLSAEAEKAAVQGVAGGLSSAGSLNYAKIKASAGAGGVAITDSSDACAGATNSVSAGVATLMQGGASFVTTAATSSGQYSIAGVTGSQACTAGTMIQCKIGRGGTPTAPTYSAIAYIPCTN